jgi:hypothetical protein
MGGYSITVLIYAILIVLHVFLSFRTNKYLGLIIP